MARIKALTPEVYNKIAAGEVVDNPVGVVKELAENSVDAGAHHISIELLDGGCKQITVADDGCGINEEDVELAFEKYATSKLESADDLIGIQSLGFRGEALSSIAAVSKVKITTRAIGAEVGVCACVENGVVTDKQYVAGNTGTKIEVRDLYYNMPARKKFLKGPSGAKAEITKFVAKFILTNPNIAITYVADGKTIYESKGAGLDEAIFAVYGADCLSNCIPINYARGDLRITGYIGTPEYCKANRNYQTFSVNGRCVFEEHVSASIAQAYKYYLMTRKFPFYVLDLEIPADLVDVNVSPKKSIVEFAQEAHVAGQFYRAVQNALQEYSDRQSELLFTPSLRIENNYDPDKHTRVVEVAAKIDELMQDGMIETMNPGQRDDVLAIEALTEEEEQKREFDEFAKRLGKELSVERARRRMGFDVAPQEVEQEPTPIVPEETIPPVLEYDEYDDLLSRRRILGIAFKTYVIIELQDKVIFIDQHAAHERILFDKFLEGTPMVMQPLAVPFTFTVREDEALFIEQNLANFLSAGIEVEPFGVNTFRINAVASMLIENEMNDFVDFLLSSIDDFKLDDRKLIVEAIAKKACKAAVKAGQTLREPEIDYILKKMRDDKILQCPHGRPITVTFSKSQLEKMFKRIV